jgi:hypothetical protein
MRNARRERRIKRVDVERNVDRRIKHELQIVAQLVHLDRFHPNFFTCSRWCALNVRTPTWTNRFTSFCSMMRANGLACELRFPW